MKRRELIKLAGAVAATAGTRALAGPAAGGGRHPDVAVIGAGVFGAWTAAWLHRSGRRVVLVEAVAPAHSGASSGGESRVTRCGYGDATVYAEWAARSQREWAALSSRAALPLFHRLGVLWVHARGDAFVEVTTRGLTSLAIPFEQLTAGQLRERYPALRVRDDEGGVLESTGGALMARRAVQQLVAGLREDGVALVRAEVEPVSAAHGRAGALPALRTVDGTRIEAEQFVFACGPWLDRVCPEAMAGRLFVTRQEVVFFGAPPRATGELPVWAVLPFYGCPDLEGRGFKVACDRHGDAVDMSRVDRRPSPQAEAQAREFLRERFPALADAPVNESRVCQYENSSNGDLLIDRHPGLDNVWLVGCGSGHGFKHGPAVGEHVAGLLAGTASPIARFSLASKNTRQRRVVQ